MRISGDPDDPGHAEAERMGICTTAVAVMLDGRPVVHPVTADDVLGLVIVYVLDEDGQVRLDPWTRFPQREALHGQVRIIPTPTFEGRWPHRVPPRHAIVVGHA